MYKGTIFFLFYLLLLLSSCYKAAKISNQNLAFSYNIDTQVLHPLYSVYHSSSDKSQLHFSINTQEILYMKSLGNLNYSSKISISYSLYSSYESKQILDSGSVIIEDDASKEENVSLNGILEFKASYPNNYVLEVILLDLNRNQSSQTFIDINKSGNHTAQNFKITNAKSEQPLFRNQLSIGESFSIGYDKNSAQKLLVVRYFKPNFPLPSPPFSVQNLQTLQLTPDSIFRLSLNNSYTATLSLNKVGMYQFQSDTTARDGFTVMVFHEDYPSLTSPNHLVPPIRYITTKQEFEVLQNSVNKKLAIDNFWLSNCGNIDRAKAALKVYYNRVQNCNTFFSSYTEGWKTDRGLVYIAFGLPNSIYRDSNGETWLYGEEQNYRALTFTFSKLSNPYSENDYSLNRSENFRNDWFRMIDAWRQGKIINEK